MKVLPRRGSAGLDDHSCQKSAQWAQAVREMTETRCRYGP